MLISSVMLDVLSADVYMMAYSVGGVLVGNERALQLDPRDKRTAQGAQEAGVSTQKVRKEGGTA